MRGVVHIHYDDMGAFAVKDTANRSYIPTPEMSAHQPLAVGALSWDLSERSGHAAWGLTREVFENLVFYTRHDYQKAML